MDASATPPQTPEQSFVDRYWRSLSGNIRGCIWMLLAALSFIIVQSLTKALGGAIPSAEIAFFRCAVGSIAVLPFILSRRLDAFRTPNLTLQLLRGVFGAGAVFLMVFSVVHMPIADTTVLGFTRMLFLIILAVLFLGEKVNWRRWGATAVGFGGVVLMLRPGDSTFQLAAFSAVGAALCFASAHTCIKLCTTRSDHPMTVQTYYSITSTLLTLVPAILVWVTPDFEQALILLAMGVMSGVAQSCTAYAYGAGEATFVSPFDYTRLLWAAMAGWFLFSEPLGFTTLLGAAVIIGANIYIARNPGDKRKDGKTPG